MASEIRVNKINNRAGLGTITIADTGVVVNGIVTCTEVSGLNVLNIAGVSTFASTLDINGDIDVDGHTNLDNLSVAGVTTFSNKIQVGTGVTIEANQVATGQATFTGIVTASAFKLSDGSNVGGVESDAQSNTIGGTDAGINLDSDTYSNTFFGHSSGKQINSGDGNTAVGQYSLQNGTSATENSCFGYGAGRATTGNQNTLIGYAAATNNQSGPQLTAVGYQALYSNTTADRNTAVGYKAGYSVTTASWVTAVGFEAVKDATNGACTALGGQAIGRGQAQGCTAVGYKALYGASGGQNYYSTAIGQKALENSNAHNNYNTALGYEAGDLLTSGTHNIIIGANADPSSATVSGEVTIGDSNINHVRIPGIGVSFSAGGAVIAGVVTATNFVKADGSSVGNDLTSVTSNIVPDSDNARDLGTSSARWNELYIQSIKGNQNQHIFYDANGAIEMFAKSTQFIGMKVNGKGLEIRNNSRVIPTTSGVINFGDATNKWNEIHANSFHGSGANLTSLPSANLTGALPAISGANLTNLPPSAPVGGASTNTVFFENAKEVAVNYQITSTKNAMSAGPIAINAGIAVTVPSGCAWTIV